MYYVGSQDSIEVDIQKEINYRLVHCIFYSFLPLLVYPPTPPLIQPVKESNKTNVPV